MALTETRPETESGATAVAARPAPTQIEQLVAGGDHLANGRVYTGFALVFLTLAALGVAIAGLDRLTDDGLFGGIADTLWPSSILGLVLMGVLPLLVGLAIQVVPLQVGSPSVAFPRAAALSMWAWLVGAVLFVTSVVLDGGVGGADDELTRMGNLSIGLMMVALVVGAVCVATTVLAHRPVGMGLARVPFFSWSMLVAAPIWIVTLCSATAHVFLGHISRADAAGLATTYESGIAWLLRAPAVYMLCIPLLGITADAVVHLTGRRLAPYGLFQGAIAAFGVLSFGVWSQTSGAQHTIVWTAFVVLAGLPVLAFAGGVADALRRSRPRPLASLGAALLGHLLLLGAILAAALQALDSAGQGSLFGFHTASLGDAQTFFVVAAATLGGLAGLFHWGERLLGAPAAEGAARVGALAVLLGGGLLATVMLVHAIAAADGRDGLPWELLNGVIAAGALVFALGVLAALAAVLGAARKGYEDGPLLDGAPTGLTLEWSSTGLASAGDPTTEVGAVRSPYPLLDLRDGGASDEESN